MMSETWMVVGNAGVNKAVLDLALGASVPATLITMNTCVRAALSLNEGACGPIPSL